MIKMATELLIFDLDGTLVDSRKDLVSAINFMRTFFKLKELGFDKVVSFIGHGITNLVEKSIEGSENIKLEDAIKVTKEYYSKNLIVETTLYEGVIDGIKDLHESGFKLAILSNKPMKLTKEVVKYFKLDKYFEYIIGASDKFPIKPNPTAINYILNELNIEKKNSWMIGDHNTDLEVAKNAEINACFASYGFGSQGNEKYTIKVDSFKEFTKKILG